MQTVILAGGLATRLTSILGAATPKSLVPVAGRPFIEHQLALLRQQGFSEILLCVGHLGSRIEAHVGDGHRFGVRLTYSYEPVDALLGTGGALLHALAHLDEQFLLLYGDSYLTADYGALIDWNRSRGYPGVMSVYRNDNGLEPSNVTVSGERVSRYAKGLRDNGCDHIDYGLSLFERAVVSRYAGTRGSWDLGRLQSDLIAANELGAFQVHERYYEVGSSSGLAELDRLLRTR